MADHPTEIDGLIDEHRALIAISGALQRASDADVAALLDQLEDLLTRHTKREEAGLFHVLRTVDVPPAYVGLFEHDHTHLSGLVAAARSDPGGIDGLSHALEAHMAREENDMFPAAEQLLAPADWDTVDAAVAGLG